MPKTNAECAREYRKRKREKNLNKIINKPRKKAKTGAERAKAYRERKKQAQLLSNENFEKRSLEQERESSMPRKYCRKNSNRAVWSEQALEEAIEKVRKNEIGKREAERRYGIPLRTLNRRIKSGIIEKMRLGPDSCLGKENEKRLVQHINKLSELGFAPSNSDIRNMAFEFAEKLKIPHKFNRESKRAGYDWLLSFLERNPEVSITQPEGQLLPNAKGINRISDDCFFTILEQSLAENDLLNKPSNIFNMNESRLKLNEETEGHEGDEESSEKANSLPARKKGDFTVMACCSADGKYIPPVIILKGVNENPEFSNELPSGTAVYMNNNSANISKELFLKWLSTQFIPNKPTGKVVLILEANSIHFNIDVLETAIENDIVLLSLPNHSTQGLQSLERALFDPFEKCYIDEVDYWMRNNPDKTVSQLEVAKLVCKAWQKASTVENAVSGFQACGIYPLNPYQIPDHFLAPLIMHRQTDM